MKRKTTKYAHNDQCETSGRDGVIVGKDGYSNMRYTTRLIPSRANNLGVLLLNNPKALHAVTRDMVDCADDVLRKWKSDPTLKAILIKSSKEVKRASFCAGGDVKSVYLQGLEYHANKKERKHVKRPEDFFRYEYKVIHKIATCIDKIPVVSFWDGLVMGGGVGLSIYGKYRVATERTIFSMPETRIGFFPDVGSMWWMTRLLQRPIANFLALTGERLKPEDLLYTGLATHYVPSNRLEDLEYALAEATRRGEKEDVVASVLTSFHESIPIDHCNIAINIETIEKTFNGNIVEELFVNLKQANTEFSMSTLDVLKKTSPTSLKVTMEGLNRGAKCKTFAEDLQMEYRMAKAFVQSGSDFYEGIRSVLIDKENSPKWKPAKLEEVSDDMIRKFFSPIKNDEWTHLQDAESSKL